MNGVYGCTLDCAAVGGSKHAVLHTLALCIVHIPSSVCPGVFQSTTTTPVRARSTLHAHLTVEFDWGV
jgi:hypothetical protein